MFNVLIVLDASSNTDEALTLATTLLAGKDVQITLLHVMPRHLINGKGDAVVDDDDMSQDEQAASTAVLDAAAGGCTVKASVQSSPQSLRSVIRPT